MKTKGLSNAQAKQQQSIFVIRSYRLNKVWWIYLADSRLCTPHSSMHTMAVYDTSMPMLICIVVNDSIYTSEYQSQSIQLCSICICRQKCATNKRIEWKLKIRIIPNRNFIQFFVKRKRSYQVSHNQRKICRQSCDTNFFPSDRCFVRLIRFHLFHRIEFWMICTRFLCVLQLTSMRQQQQRKSSEFS